MLYLILLACTASAIARYVAIKEYFSDPSEIDLDENKSGQKYTSDDVFKIVNKFLSDLGGEHSCINVSMVKRVAAHMKLRCFIQNNNDFTLQEYEVVGKIPMSTKGSYEIVYFEKRYNKPSKEIHGGRLENAEYANIRKS